MSTPGPDDYPLAEKHPERVRGRRGKTLDELTLEALASGEAELEDFRITPEALRQQAAIARAAARPRLADNFERAAEMAGIPQAFVMQVYELLRPGRATDSAPLLEAARTLRDTYQAERLAAFVEEAAMVYERRGLYTFRYR